MLPWQCLVIVFCDAECKGISLSLFLLWFLKVSLFSWLLCTNQQKHLHFHWPDKVLQDEIVFMVWHDTQKADLIEIEVRVLTMIGKQRSFDKITVFLYVG